MVRHILTLLTAAIIIGAVTTTSAQICTPAVQEALAPCQCTEDELTISCLEETDLKAVFERVSSMVDDNVVFELVDLAYFVSAPVHIPANVFGSLKTKGIKISHWYIESIHPDAFNSTYEHTRIFTAGNDGISSTAENHEIFGVLNRFRNLEELDIGYNLITYIPDDPFPEPMPNLKKMAITENRLEYLGARVFANLPALESAYLISIDLTLDEMSPAAFEGIGPNVTLFLNWNAAIDHLPEEIFSPVLNNAAGLWVGGYCDGGACPRQRLACDERINWICRDVDAYEPKLDGYYCREGTGSDHIWEYCASLNGTSH